MKLVMGRSNVHRVQISAKRGRYLEVAKRRLFSDKTSRINFRTLFEQIQKRDDLWPVFWGRSDFDQTLIKKPLKQSFGTGVVQR